MRDAWATNTAYPSPSEKRKTFVYPFHALHFDSSFPWRLPIVHETRKSLLLLILVPTTTPSSPRTAPSAPQKTLSNLLPQLPPLNPLLLLTPHPNLHQQLSPLHLPQIHQPLQFRLRAHNHRAAPRQRAERLHLAAHDHQPDVQAANVAGEEVDGAGDMQRRGEQGAGELREDWGFG